ncbi:uncharacterized protein LOC135398414 [Ornithodoros turicata]|uniref:uncharacterized protein LOC135398414 n=1 Tax=Ornithodoros turicata TaxID=34597 RepID=UPI003139C2A4
MVLKVGTVPAIQSARRVPQMLKRPLKEELDRMEAQGIIAKMEEHFDWRTVALRDLLKEGCCFEWTKSHAEEWQSLRNSLASSPVLAFFDPRLETKVSTDASQFGLGAALLQLHDSEWLPVAYASRVLTEVEGRQAPAAGRHTVSGTTSDRNRSGRGCRRGGACSINSFNDGLLNYRTTPQEDGNTPAELLMGRRLRTRLPDIRRTTQVQVRKHQQDSSRGTLPKPLLPGQHVRVLQDGAWTLKGKIQDVAAPRSYKVVTEDNRPLRRNRQHLLPAPERYVPTRPDMDSARHPENGHRVEPPATEDSSQSVTESASPSKKCLPSSDDGKDSEPCLRRSSRTRRPPDRLVYT